MKKFIAVILVLAFCCIVMSGCSNRSWGDFVQSFEYGKVRLADGTVVEGKVQSWLDFEDSDMIQVRINDETYLTHSMNVTLISD